MDGVHEFFVWKDKFNCAQILDVPINAVTVLHQSLSRKKCLQKPFARMEYRFDIDAYSQVDPGCGALSTDCSDSIKIKPLGQTESVCHLCRRASKPDDTKGNPLARAYARCSTSKEGHVFCKPCLDSLSLDCKEVGSGWLCPICRDLCNCQDCELSTRARKEKNFFSSLSLGKCEMDGTVLNLRAKQERSHGTKSGLSKVQKEIQEWEEICDEKAVEKEKRILQLQINNLKVGTEVEVFWPMDNTWYSAKVDDELAGKKNCVHILYDDGEEEKLNIFNVQWRFKNADMVVDVVPEAEGEEHEHEEKEKEKKKEKEKENEKKEKKKTKEKKDQKEKKTKE